MLQIGSKAILLAHGYRSTGKEVIIKDRKKTSTGIYYFCKCPTGSSLYFNENYLKPIGLPTEDPIEHAYSLKS